MDGFIVFLIGVIIGMAALVLAAIMHFGALKTWQFSTFFVVDYSIYTNENTEEKQNGITRKSC